MVDPMCYYCTLRSDRTCRDCSRHVCRRHASRRGDDLCFRCVAV